MLLSVVLVFGILVQILYLTKDMGGRFDLTQEKLYSLSPSTKSVLDKLQEPLVIEAYFSRELPGQFEIERRKIVDLLDEYKQIGGSKVQLLYLDPLADESVREKATRLGIEERPATVLKDDSISQSRLYQGLRVRYGGDRQKVLSFVQGADALESELTPQIRELVIAKKPKVGLLVRPEQQNQFARMQGQPTPSYSEVERVIRGRYEVVNIDVSKGQVLPEDLDVIIVIHPKDVTDWEKYCIDQHVMHGGNLMVFAEAADYTVDQWQTYFRNQFQVDQPESKLLWKDLLAAWGFDLSGKLVADMERGTWNPWLSVKRQGGGAMLMQSYMPYWFFAQALPWQNAASQLTDDAEAARELEKKLGPGIDQSHPILQGTRQITMFWATDVGLLEKLPDGVKGQVLLRSSPLALLDEPPQTSVPEEVLRNLAPRRGKEMRRQAALMSLAQGTFPSAWKGKEMPKRPLPEEPKTDKNGGLLQDPPPQDPPKQEPPKQEAPKPDAGQQPPAPQPEAPKGDQQPPVPPPAGEQAPATTPPPVQGPPAPAPAAKPEEKLPPRLDQGEKESRIVVIGDASLIRDDFLQGVGYGSGRSMGGLELFQNTLDWMALDTDLVGLRNKRQVDRRLTFVKVDPTSQESEEEVRARIASRKRWWRLTNILLPVVLLLGFGGFLWSKRAAEKRGFLAGTQK